MPESLVIIVQCNAGVHPVVLFARNQTFECTLRCNIGFCLIQKAGGEGSLALLAFRLGKRIRAVIKPIRAPDVIQGTIVALLAFSCARLA